MDLPQIWLQHFRWFLLVGEFSVPARTVFLKTVWCFFGLGGVENAGLASGLWVSFSALFFNFLLFSVLFSNFLLSAALLSASLATLAGPPDAPLALISPLGRPLLLLPFLLPE